MSFNAGVWGPTFLGLLLKLLFGVLGALAFASYTHENVFDIMLEESGTPAITRVATYIYAIGTILPGIPPVSIILRYGLYTEGLCSPTWAMIWAVVFPWVVGLFLAHAEAMMTLMNWTALFASGFTNFILPILLWIKALEVATENQRNHRLSRLIEKQEEQKVNPPRRRIEDWTTDARSDCTTRLDQIVLDDLTEELLI